MRTRLITIPAKAVAILRGALLEQIGATGSELESISTIGDDQIRAEQYRQMLVQLDAHRALLDLISWNTPARERPVEVDLVRHEQSLLAAFEEELETDAYVQQDKSQTRASRRQRRRAARDIRAIERFLATLEQQDKT